MEATYMERADLEQESSSWLTVERVAYIAIGLLAAGLRILSLGLRPLNEAEAAQAVAAFRFAQGIVKAAPADTIPALFTSNVVGFTLLGANDAFARWLPALAGVILVLLPYGLRHRLGRGGALAASLLLAVSSSSVFFSRSLDSAMVVAACGLALVVGAINYLDTRRSGYLYLAAVALGLGLVSGSGIYTLLLIIAAFVLLIYLGERLLGRGTGWSSLVVAWEAARSEGGLLAKAGVALAASFGLVAMAFMLHPAGVGHAADLVSAWARSFLPEAGGQPLIYPVLLLLRYELLIVVLGLVEIVRWAARGRSDPLESILRGSLFPHTTFLVFWVIIALLIILVSGHRPAGNILLIVAPLALLAGQGVERAWRWISQRSLWFEAGVFAAIALGLAVFFYLWLTAYSLASGTATVSAAGITLHASVSYLILASVAVALLIALGIVAWAWRGRDLVVAGSWLAMVLILGLVGFKAMWGINFTRATDARELMLLQTTAPDVRLLADRLEALSLAESGDAHTLMITVDAATGPVVAWYLRDFDRQTVVENLVAPPETPAAVTLAMQDPPIGETFRGQGFPLRAHWLPWGLWGQDLVRWLLFGEGSLPVVDQEAVLWVQSTE